MQNFSDLVNTFIGLITLVIPLIFALTFLVIAWKVIDAWIIHAGDANKIEEGKKHHSGRYSGACGHVGHLGDPLYPSVFSLLGIVKDIHR